MPRAKRDNNGKRQFKYTDTFDLYSSLMPERDATVPRAQRRRVQRAAGFRNYLKRTKKARRFMPSDPILKQITGFEYLLLMNLCHIAIYRSLRFFGVCISVRDLAEFLPGRNSLDKVNTAIRRLVELNLVAVLEPGRGSRARVLMPNPSGEPWTPPPLCSEQKNKGNLCTDGANTKEGGTPFVSSSGGTQGEGLPIKRKTPKKEIAPPPPAQKGQGGASERDPAPLSKRSPLDPDVMDEVLRGLTRNSEQLAAQGPRHQQRVFIGDGRMTSIPTHLGGDVASFLGGVGA